MASTPKAYQCIVLGGGNSAGYFAKRYVELGGERGSLAILGEEPVVSYERPALSKAYLAQEGAARLPGFHTCVGGGGERQDAAWYAAAGIDFLVATRVTAVDVAAKTLTTDGGASFAYDKLVVATGARSVTLHDLKTPGAGLAGVHTLRDVADADALVAAMAAARAGSRRALCIGGGYIGLEVAAALAGNGLTVTMVFPEAHMMSRLWTPEIAAQYQAYYAAKGVTIVAGDLVVALEGDAAGRVTHAVLRSGARLEAGLVVVGVGARPNTGLFEGQLRTLAGPPGGVAVDARLRTSHPDVLAIGDVAAFPLAAAGGALSRQEHVANCRQMAAAAAEQLLAPDTAQPYEYLPFFYSREFDLSWQFYGSSDGAAVVFGALQSDNKLGAYWVDGGKVVGCFLENGTPEEFAAIKAVAQKRPAAPADLVAQGLRFASKL